METKHKVDVCICKICKKLCGNLNKLKSHMKKTHSIKKDKRRHECIICGDGFTAYSNIKTHFAKEHTGLFSKFTFNCDICDENLLSKLQIERHILSEHAKPVKCLDKTCFKSFSSIFVRRTHHLTYHNRDRKVS